MGRAPAPHVRNRRARRRLLALIQDPSVIHKILAHLGLDDEPVELTPARSPPELELAF
jgi:hypothetical protein